MLKTAPMSDDDMLKTITMCKDQLQRSHDIVHKSLPKVNSEVKDIVEVIRKMEKHAANESTLLLLRILVKLAIHFLVEVATRHAMMKTR